MTSIIRKFVLAKGSSSLYSQISNLEGRDLFLFDFNFPSKLEKDKREKVKAFINYESLEYSCSGNWPFPIESFAVKKKELFFFFRNISKNSVIWVPKGRMNSKGQFYVITVKRSNNGFKSQFQVDAIIDFASHLISSEKGQVLYSNYFKPVGFFQNQGGKWISFLQLKNFFFNSMSLGNVLIKSSFKYGTKKKITGDSENCLPFIALKKQHELFEYSKLPFFVVLASSRLINIFFLKLLVLISHKKN